MPRRRIETIAILGDGPAATTLATLVARTGRRVGLFSAGERPELIVGESLVPAIIPILRTLGVEEEIASFSVYKPGATFVLSSTERQRFEFADVRGSLPGYAYNVPRDRFDAVLKRTCVEAGACIIEARGRVEVVGGDLRLDPESIIAADGLFGDAPDLIVDATGRTRTLARLLDLPTTTGDRRDAALFAHLDGVVLDDPGNVHTDRLERGWAWRIPLRERTSLGVVVDHDVLKRFGRTAEEQYDGYLAQEPRLKALTSSARRITPVMKYTNYQLVTERGVGEGWALLGDAFGFVDPVFSSGLYLAMDGARHLLRALEAGTTRAFERYARHSIDHIRAWQTIVRYFYDGRLFTLFKVGDQMAENFIGKLANPHARKHLPQIFTGEATDKFYSRRLLDFMIQNALRGHEPRDLMVS